MANIGTSRFVRMYLKEVEAGRLPPFMRLIEDEITLADAAQGLSFLGVNITSKDPIEVIVGLGVTYFGTSSDTSSSKGHPMDGDDENKELIALGKEFIHAAKHWNNQKVIEFIENGFPVNFQDPRNHMTAFHWSVINNNYELADYLIGTKKCDYLLKDKFGFNANVVAIRHGENNDFIMKLSELTKQACVDAKKEYREETLQAMIDHDTKRSNSVFQP